MATLTNVAKTTRRLIILFLFISILGIFLVIVFSSIRTTITKLKKPPPVVISTTFDKIPKVTFPQQQFPFDIKFSVETLSGGIPSASETAKVYFIPKKQQGLLTNIRASQDAKKLGFSVTPQTINKKFIFKESSKELTIDPVTRNFTYNYDFITDSSVFSGLTKLTKESALSLAQTFLNSLSAIPSDYDAKAKTTFLTFNGANFIPTVNDTDNQNATAIRVDFFRKKVDNLPVVTAQFNQGNIYVIISKSQDKNKQIIKAERNYLEVSYEDIGIYPVKKGSLAWEDFLKGNGYIANAGNSTFTKRVVIRDAYLAYYDGGNNQSYFVPVYVFAGDNDFVAYVNAISEEWLSK